MLNKTSISSRLCLNSRYIVPKKLRGKESWKTSWLTITRSPTVMVPVGSGADKLATASGCSLNKTRTVQDTLSGEEHHQRQRG